MLPALDEGSRWYKVTAAELPLPDAAPCAGLCPRSDLAVACAAQSSHCCSQLLWQSLQPALLVRSACFRAPRTSFWIPLVPDTSIKPCFFAFLQICTSRCCEMVALGRWGVPKRSIFHVVSLKGAQFPLAFFVYRN